MSHRLPSLGRMLGLQLIQGKALTPAARRRIDGSLAGMIVERVDRPDRREERRRVDADISPVRRDDGRGTQTGAFWQPRDDRHVADAVLMPPLPLLLPGHECVLLCLLLGEYLLKFVVVLDELVDQGVELGRCHSVEFRLGIASFCPRAHRADQPVVEPLAFSLDGGGAAIAIRPIPPSLPICRLQRDAAHRRGEDDYHQHGPNESCAFHFAHPQFIDQVPVFSRRASQPRDWLGC